MPQLELSLNLKSDLIELVSTGCWNWKGYILNSGYGSIKTYRDGYRTTVTAHRWVYEKMVGPIPKGMVIDHLCKNKICVNPAHLEVVTSSENIQRGKRTKLTKEVVGKIRNGGYLDVSQRKLAKKLGVTQATIWKIKNGKRWVDAKCR